MAPKARKVTKKPAAATIFPQDVLKRVSGPKCLNDAEVITQAALLQLEDQPVAKIGAWLDGFSDTEQQRLWKKYQANREYEGTDDNYRVLTKGTGGKTLSKALLKVWISSGCTRKGKVYQTHVAKIANITKRGQLDQWQPLAWMSTKYGTRELKARVVAGSIQVRRNPLDPRFPEFLDQSEYLDCATTTEKSKNVSAEGEAAWSDFESLANIDNKGQKIQFLEGEDKDETPGQIAFGEGKKTTPNSPKLSLDWLGLAGGEPGPAPSASGSQSSSILKMIDDASFLAASKDISQEKLKLAVLKA